MTTNFNFSAIPFDEALSVINQHFCAWFIHVRRENYLCNY